MSRRKVILLTALAVVLFGFVYVVHNWFWLLVASWLLSIASV